MPQDHVEGKAPRSVKAKNLPWYKRCPADWRRGTRKHAMSMELRGFYSECLDAMWELQDQLPKDAKVLAMMLGTNARLVRSLMPMLVATGKFLETPIGYYNSRMMADILGVEEVEVQTRLELQSSSSRAPIDLQSSSKVPEKPILTTREVDLDKEVESKKEAVLTREKPKVETIDYQKLQGKLTAACNGSLANPAAAPGLLNLSEPMIWLDQGCDLDRDILPTLQEIGSRRHGAGISSWRYFSKAVAAARDARRNGLPESAGAGAKPGPPAISERSRKAQQFMDALRRTADAEEATDAAG